jgi:nitroreductase
LFENMDHSHSKALDEILGARHTVRSFSTTPLEKEKIEQIIRAGLIAPFAAMAVIGKKDWRKVFVIPATSPTIGQMKAVVAAGFPGYVKELESEFGLVPFVKMLKSSQVTSSLLDKPYIVIIGEKRGVPEVASESVSYSMESMWLKATALKVGFQPITAIVGLKLGDDEEFCKILGIPCGEYHLDGFALGYPADGYKPAPVQYPDFESAVQWL